MAKGGIDAANTAITSLQAGSGGSNTYNYGLTYAFQSISF
jgi:hypothetical protein